MATPETFLSFETVKKLVSKLAAIQKTRAKDIEKIADIFGNPLELAKVYIEPDCQQFNPANLEEDRPQEVPYVTSPVFKTLEKFLRGGRKDENDGRYVYFILSDAGMGKTSLLCMLKLSHLMSFWPTSRKCELFKLGPDTVENINKLEHKNNTVLLLDSVDEDPLGWGRVEERLNEIIRATIPFYRTIITCRTQFFPETAPDPFGSRDMVKVGNYRCPLVYLSLFDEEKVEEYLQQRFPSRLFFFGRNRKRRDTAKIIVRQMDSLSCRPLLLSHIEDLVDKPTFLAEKYASSIPGVVSNRGVWTEFEVYNALVASWLSREAAKLVSNPLIQQKALAQEALALERACAHLAVTIQLEDRRTVSSDRISKLCAEVPEVSDIHKIDIKGRSLLNKNSKGEYRFSHYSIQEFLVVKAALSAVMMQGQKRGFLKTARHVVRTSGFGRLPSVSDELQRLTWNVAKDRNMSDIDGSVVELNKIIHWTAQMTRFAQSAALVYAGVSGYLPEAQNALDEFWAMVEKKYGPERGPLDDADRQKLLELEKQFPKSKKNLALRLLQKVEKILK